MDPKASALHIANIARLPAIHFHLGAGNRNSEVLTYGTLPAETLDIVNILRLMAVAEMKVDGRMYLFKELSGMSFLFVAFPEVAQCTVFGPVLVKNSNKMSLSQTIHSYFKDSLPGDKIQRILDSILFIDQPFIESWRMVSNKVFGLDVERVEEISEETPPTERSYEIIDLAKTRMTESSVRYAYGYEARIKEAIRKGDRTTLYELLVPPREQKNLKDYAVQFNLEDRFSNNMGSQFKNFLITVNTIFRLTAQEAGLPPVYLHNVSRTIASDIERVKDYEDARFLYRRLIDIYCDVINRSRLESHSFRIVRVQKYILSHLSEDISMDTLAEIAELSKPHLSRQFKKECNVTITQYIRTQKINEAMLMLRSDEASVQSIAEELGFSSQSYFCDVFRAETGMTPSQYRCKCEQENPLG